MRIKTNIASHVHIVRPCLLPHTLLKIVYNSVLLRVCGVPLVASGQGLPFVSTIAEAAFYKHTYLTACYAI